MVSLGRTRVGKETKGPRALMTLVTTNRRIILVTTLYTTIDTRALDWRFRDGGYDQHIMDLGSMG